MPLASHRRDRPRVCRRLLFAEYDRGDPLQQLIEHYADKKAESKKGTSLGETVEERLKQAIIQGRRETLIADLDAARERYSPIDIINKILLDGMKVVGDLFGSGQMQLPFVLQSAEVMKAAVAYLEQFMEKVEGAEKGQDRPGHGEGRRPRHRQEPGGHHPVEQRLQGVTTSASSSRSTTMIAAFQEHEADAIGMSGLLVKSTVVMKEDLSR